MHAPVGTSCMATPFPRPPRVAQPASRTLSFLLATAQGVQRIPSGSTKLQPAGLLARDVACLARGSDGAILAGTYGGGAYASDDGSDWRALPIDARDVWTFGTLADGTMLAGCEPAAVFAREGEAWRRLALSFAPGASGWSSPWGAADVGSILADAVDPKRFFVGIEVGGVYLTEDGGETWIERNEGLHPDVHALAAHPSRPARILASTADGVHRSDDGGATWRRTSHGIARTYTVPLLVSAAQPDVVWTAGARGPSGMDTRVYRSEDGGERWREVTGGLPRGLKGIARQGLVEIQGDPPMLAIGTAGGDLYVSEDAGATWKLAAQGVPPIQGLLAVPG